MTRATWGLTVLLAMAACLCAPRSAFAQHAAESFLSFHPATQQNNDSRAPQPAFNNALRMSAELDPALALGLGYMRVLPFSSRSGRKAISVHGDVTALWGFTNWDITTGATLRLRQKPGWDLQVTADLELKIVHDDVRSGVTYGYGVGLRPGWFGKTFFVAGDLSLKGNFAQTLAHSQAYKDQFPTVVDGTYLSDTLFFYPGVAAGVTIAKRFVVGSRFAWRVPRDLKDYSPYYLPYTFEFEAGVFF